MSDARKFVVQPNQPRDRLIHVLTTFIEALPMEIPWIIEISRLKQKRSSLQNRALWGCAYKYLADETGHDPEELHRFFCGEYFGWSGYVVFDQPRKRPARTTTTNEEGKRDVVDVETFIKFYDFIQYRMAEFGYMVPDPDPNWKQTAREEERRKAA